MELASAHGKILPNTDVASVELALTVYADETVENAIAEFLATSASDAAKIMAEVIDGMPEAGRVRHVRFTGPAGEIAHLVESYHAEAGPTVTVEMLDDEGNVEEECKAHICTGDPKRCEYPAACDDEFEGDGGTSASPSTPVYVWTTASDMSYAVCGPCLANDSYARLSNKCDAHGESFDSPEALLDHIRSEH